MNPSGYMGIMLLVLFATACLPTPSPTAGDAPYIWQGWVYGDFPSQDAPGLETGTVRLWAMDGELIAEGAQLDASRPSLWTLEIDETQAAEVRISGPDHPTTVWRTATPTAQSFWYAGTLFAPTLASIEAFWSDLAEVAQADLATEQGANLLGESLLVWPEDEAGWTGASVTVYDGEGRVHAAVTLSTDDDGFLVPSDGTDRPITTFAATGLAPGPVRLVIDSADGRSAVMDYNAGPGELLSAFSFTLPEPQ